MQAFCDVAFEYAHVRKQFSKPIGTFQVSKIEFESTEFNRLTYVSVNSSENGRHVYDTQCLSFVSLFNSESS